MCEGLGGGCFYLLLFVYVSCFVLGFFVCFVLFVLFFFVCLFVCFRCCCECVFATVYLYLFACSYVIPLILRMTERKIKSYNKTNYFNLKYNNRNTY